MKSLLAPKSPGNQEMHKRIGVQNNVHEGNIAAGHQIMCSYERVLAWNNGPEQITQTACKEFAVVHVLIATHKTSA
jgi:hypothetical protein